ncbi:MAG: GGDEF domain-containing protein [Ketobacter sp.]
MIHVIRSWLSRATPSQRCIAAIVLCTPFLLLFIMTQSVGLFVPDWRAMLVPGYVVMANAVLLGCIAIGWLVIALLWRNRMNTRPLPKTYAFVASVLGLAFTVEAILLGPMTYPAGLVIVGIIPIGIMLLDLRSVGLAFVMGVTLFWANDMATYAGFLDYAPGYGDQAFVDGQHQLIAEMLRSGTLYISLVAYGVITWILFDQYDYQRAHLSRLARTDPLTNLSNRRNFMQRLEEECQRQNRIDQPLSLVMMDADHFKSVNDRYGHIAGDSVLAGIAGVLTEVMRVPADLPARIGGEEFAILLPETGLQGALQVCRRIEQRLENQAFQSDGHAFYVTLSMGIVESNGLDAGALMHLADANLFKAKAQGRNGIVSTVEEGLAYNARSAPLA